MADEILKRDQNFVPVLAGITDDSNQYIKMVRVNPTTGRLLVSATGGGTGTLTKLTPTGSVDGNNTVFTTTEEPTFVFSDHAYYEATNSNSSVNWTWNAGLLQITMTIPPTEDLVLYKLN